jgi:hypothetical protein
MFPFLAVLICTMGVMIVLLVLGVQQAQVDARVVVDQQLELESQWQQEHQQKQLERDDYRWQSEVLTESRDEKTRDLADARLALGHLEQHIRELELAGQQLLARKQLLEKNPSPAEELEVVQRQMSQLAGKVEHARQALELARGQLAASEQSFSIVPYDGPNGTRRYPIYLECTPRGVLIQPEGVLVPLADLSRLSGPGNPLDACLRTIREYLVSRAGRKAYGDPYPLLVVRPDSVISYALARRAMKSWEDAFGYELIDSDIKLTYPAANPTLARQLEQTIRDARQRQQHLAAAMPSQFGSNGGAWGDSRGHQRAGGQRGSPPVTAAQRQRPASLQGGTQMQAPVDPGKAGARQLKAGGIEGREFGWALPRKNQQRTGVTRPVYVTCQADRLIIVPRRGERGRVRTVHLEGALEDNIDSFVSEIWDHMERWGIAVAGGYWKPVLKVEVRPGGATRFAELSRLMKNSGILVQQYR